MATLTSRISLQGDEPDGPEDYLSTSLGVIFPDDIVNQHGDAEHSLVYASPKLPKPLLIELADPEGETDRRLFSHYLWNASLLLAELIERDSLDNDAAADSSEEEEKEKDEGLGKGISFDTRGLHTLELGAGTALPSMMAGLLGAASVVVTDYPAPAVIKTLRANVARNIKPELAPVGKESLVTKEVLVEGHEWGASEAKNLAFPASHKHASDRLFVADCLWMPWQHANLRRSINHFLKRDASARAWVIAGFHTGRPKMAGFFDAEALREEGGVEVERMWERDCDGVEREWDREREDDITERKRWLVVAVLKRCEDMVDG
ncbi:nicotinamide N-methyltransferase [Trichoderma reesei RUT C-30]|uniref:Nicotinamide N-methyltransferase n=1 Tax=Hypocrea jecorina (strain ATCC 56765 / BCRC 32924 / NRRL 11460 / Rut C-30) TaxID=1344414 RepID=A0A024S2A4_HYPJR|nr:nicotinamide N-methyltransferase [Trichoderma reesei RUT C-30]